MIRKLFRTVSWLIGRHYRGKAEVNHKILVRQEYNLAEIRTKFLSINLLDLQVSQSITFLFSPGFHNYLHTYSLIVTVKFHHHQILNYLISMTILPCVMLCAVKKYNYVRNQAGMFRPFYVTRRKAGLPKTSI
jgi:hypothetical protein